MRNSSKEIVDMMISEVRNHLSDIGVMRWKRYVLSFDSISIDDAEEFANLILNQEVCISMLITNEMCSQ